jgi:hydroxyacylglutathione hydrolase
MYFSRLYDRQLAQASYIIGCPTTGEALVVDPHRDVSVYVDVAGAERLRIKYVTETHIHADFVSGSRELARRTGALLVLSGEGGPDWQYAFAESSGAQLLRDGDRFMVGRIQLHALHTPGHTPEHLSFLVTDLSASPIPVMILTGDFVFVGDVGRPDLLERAAKQANTMEEAARTLWRSVQRFRTLPDHIQLWPGHGAGSACGKALGAMPSSTVGYEKLVNWGVSASDEETFVRGVLEGQPEPPAYFARMKRVNREGPAILGGMPSPPALDEEAAKRFVKAGALIVDIRPADAFARSHVEGAINVPFTRSFTTYGGSVIPYDVPLILESSDDAVARVNEAARHLAMIGYDEIVGFAGPPTVRGLPAATSTRVTAPDAMQVHRNGMPLVDVRGRNEWDVAHVPTALNIPFPELLERTAELPGNEPFLVQCASGARSAIATSVLRRMGFDARDAGGLADWERAGGPVVPVSAS